MNRRALVLLALLGVTVAALYRFWPARPKSDLSIVLIVIDSLRVDHVGTYGYPRETTPFIDRLGDEGLVFEEALSQAPWTKPSIASLFTSTYISVHSVLFSNEIIDGEERTDVLNTKFQTLAEVLRSGGYATSAFGMKIHLRPPNGFDQGFDGFDMSARQAWKIDRKALRWLGRNDPDRFFMYLHYNDPHYPYEPAPGYARYGATSARVQIDGETKRAFFDGRLELTRRDMDQLVDLYDGEVRYTDDHIRKLIEGIESRGYMNVLVIVTADHGEEFLDHGGITHGQSLYDELVRVPLVFGGSGFARLFPQRDGERMPETVQLIDLMPTILDIAGLPPPPGLQGRSLTPLLAGEPHASRAAFSERIGADENMFWSTVREGRWKLIRDLNDGRTLLFDLLDDPGEKEPLDGIPDIVARLAASIDSWSAANRHLHDLFAPHTTRPLDPETEERLKSLGYVN